MCVPVSHFGRMVTWLMHFPALHSRFGDTALFCVCVLSWVCGRKSVRLAGVRWLAWWLVLKAVCCVFLVVVISGVFSSVVVNNSLRLVRLEAAVCSTLSASLRGVLSSESSETFRDCLLTYHCS